MSEGTPRRPEELPDALETFAALEARLTRERLAVLLDFDGTLAPIVARPEMAAASESMREVLAKLSEKVPTAIISGRDRHDVAGKLGITSMTYAGSHGYDIEGPNGLRYLAGEEFMPVLDEAEVGLKSAFAGADDVFIERKRFAIAIHYRAAAEARHQPIADEVARIAAQYSRLRRKSGKMIWELQPDFDWHKGRAIEWLLQHWPQSEHPWLPIYIGDDVTDEDGFAAVAAQGLGILVEPGEHATRASATLADVDAVEVFLKRLERAMGIEPTTFSLGS